MRFPLCLAAFLLSCVAHTQVTVTGLVDGTLSGATPRAVELYVSGSVDLSAYSLDRYANGGTDGTPTALTGTYTDAFVYVVNDAAAFASVFGSDGDFANVITSGNMPAEGT